MKRESKSFNAIKHATERGYVAQKDGTVISPSGVRLKLQATANGYHRFNVKYGNESYPIRVSNLVAYQKFGEKVFLESEQVRHLNGNRLDDSWENIDVGSVSQNSMDRPKQERIKSAKHASTFIERKDWEFIDKDRAAGYSYKELRNKYGVSLSGLSYRYSKNAKKKRMET